MTYIALTGIVLALAACGAAFLVSDGSGISRPVTVLREGENGSVQAAAMEED